MPAPVPTTLDRYVLLGRSGLRVSPLCLGTMTFGLDWGWGADAETSTAMFRNYVERGGNFIDTANFYTNGTSEKLVGQLISTDRQWYVLGTKYTLNSQRGDPNAGGNHRKSMMHAVECSLRQLGTDYLDIYWLHVWDFTSPVDEVMRGLDDLVRSGKVLHLGVSDTPAWKISQANMLAELRGWSRFVTMQMKYNVAARDCERDLIPFCLDSGVAMQPWAPLGGGLLADKYTREDLHRQEEQPPKSSGQFGSDKRIVTLNEHKLRVAETVRKIAKAVGRTPAQVALNWVLHQPGVVSPIIGARSVEQLEENMGCLDFLLDEEHRNQLEQASAIDLGFPHDMISSRSIRDMISGGAQIESSTPYVS
jgi:aryl-alcohol dehydrogenase-like predicted oxidoreductase